jgi:cbb3-type cytochrome oxidase maturation protein
MEILVVLIPLSIILIGIAGAMFLWAVDHDQFDQLDLHGLDIFIDLPKDESIVATATTKDDRGDNP